MASHWSVRAACVLVALTGSTAGSLAQTPVQPQPRDPNMPGVQNTLPEKIETVPGANLSDKLRASDGVIRPPTDVDPGITTRAPVPEPNSTPVITPPGEAGGNQSVQPK